MALADAELWELSMLFAWFLLVAGWTWSDLGRPSERFFDAFLAGFSEARCYPDCDMTTGPLVCDLFDFLCFQDAFVGGCP